VPMSRAHLCCVEVPRWVAEVGVGPSTKHTPPNHFLKRLGLVVVQYDRVTPQRGVPAHNTMRAAVQNTTQPEAIMMSESS
jgi:hypothetical protein